MTTPSSEAPIDPKLCTLKDCPNGLFVYSGSYGFKTEYKTIDQAKGTWLSDAYVVESGEYFWGGAATATERENLIVTPVAISALASKEAEIAKLRGVVEKMREALKEYVNVVVSVNDPNDFTPKVSDGGYHAREALRSADEVLK